MTITTINMHCYFTVLQFYKPLSYRFIVPGDAMSIIVKSETIL